LWFHGAAYGTGLAFVESPIAGEMGIQLGLKPLPIDNWHGSFIQGEYVPDTWGDGLDRLPYAPRVRESFKKFRRSLLAIDVEKRSRELDNTPFSKFLQGYPPEVKQWFDAYGPSNWGTLSRETSSMVAVGEVQALGGEKRKDERSTWRASSHLQRRGYHRSHRRLARIHRLGKPGQSESSILSQAGFSHFPRALVLAQHSDHTHR
jgi:hypothetical protein